MDEPFDGIPNKIGGVPCMDMAPRERLTYVGGKWVAVAVRRVRCDAANVEAIKAFLLGGAADGSEAQVYPDDPQLKLSNIIVEDRGAEAELVIAYTTSDWIIEPPR